MYKRGFIYLLLTTLFVGSCKQDIGKQYETISNQKRFDLNTLSVNDSLSDKYKGQVLYLPLYSNIPYANASRQFDLSGFIAIHNTDLMHNIKITKVLYFDNDGNLVKDFQTKELELRPLATTNYFIPEHDKSGTGANFIIEWVSDKPVTEPLVETIMVSLTGGQGVSFLSKGKIIRSKR